MAKKAKRTTNIMRAVATQYLRDQYPWLRRCDLETILLESSYNLHSPLLQQKHVIESASECHLTALPPELRNRIYEFALVSSEGGLINIIHQRRLRVPPLLLTNRQIRDEAAPIFYGQNIFVLDGTRRLGHLAWWVQLIGEKQTAMVKEVRLRARCDLFREMSLRKEDEEYLQIVGRTFDHTRSLILYERFERMGLGFEQWKFVFVGDDGSEVVRGVE